MQASG
jgi:hypothetical protein